MERVREDQHTDSIKLPVQPMRQTSRLRPAAIAAALAVLVTAILAYEFPMKHLQAKNVALNKQIGEEQSKADAAETHAKSADADAENSRADAKSANARAGDAMAQLATVKDQLAAAAERATTAKNQVVALQADMDKTKHDLETARSDSSTTQTRLAALQQQVTDYEARIGALTNQIQQAQLNEQFIKSPDLQLVTLQTKNQPAASGHILWDPATSKWLFVANGLKDPGPGKTYELWIITDKPIQAGTFKVNAAGEATLLVDLPAGLHITQAAVTDEPAGGVPAPTGQMQLAGNVQRS
jgi:hypothetical protein